MRTAALLTAAIITLCAAGCGVSRVTGSNSAENTSVRIIEHTELVPVEVEVPIPTIVEKVSTRDTLSHLENQYALSDARISRNGTLYHSLETKPQQIKARTEVKIEYRDSIVYKDRMVETTIEKPLSRWERVKINLGGYALGVCLLALLALAAKLLLKR